MTDTNNLSVKNEAGYQPVSKNGLKLMRITAALCLAVPAVLSPAIAVWLFFAQGITAAVAFEAVCLLLLAVLFFIYPAVRYRRYKYLITGDRVEIIEGVFFKSRTIVPIDRIHQIDVRRGPLETAAGTAKLVVTTAGSAAVLKFLDLAAAEEAALYLNKTVREKLKVTGAGEDV